MTREERESIINEAVERALLKIPEIVGNLITNHAAKIRFNKEFYTKYPEFKDHKAVVASVVESIEDKDFTKPLSAIIEESIPVIRKRINQVSKLNMSTVKKPNLGEL